jgi:hypothetical protein
MPPGAPPIIPICGFIAAVRVSTRSTHVKVGGGWGATGCASQRDAVSVVGGGW